MDVSDIFYSLARGGGRGSQRRREGGGRFLLLRIPGGGAFQGGGAKGPGVCLRRIGEFGGGGAKYIFCGAEMSTKFDGKPQEMLRFRDLRSKTLAFKKR